MIRQIALSIVLPLCLACAAAGADKTVSLDACDYPTAEAAGKIWKQMRADSPPIQVGKFAGKSGLKLPCNFRTNEHWRVAWDHDGKWDLAEARKIVLDICSVGRSAEMILYMRSGRGWYRANFEVPPGWRKIELPRLEFRVEGRPAGWHNITALRLAVLRGEAVDSEVVVADISAVTAKTSVAIYVNEAGVKEEDDIGGYMRIVANALERRGVGYELLNDKTVVAGRLAGKKVAILPLNPVMDKASAAAVRKFVASGGKLIVCYRMPGPIGELLGIRSAGSFPGKDGQLETLVLRRADSKEQLKATQKSWLARKVIPAKGTVVRGHWLSRDGKVTSPAITRNENGFFIGHVLTRHDRPAKDRLILEMVAELWSGAWQEAAESQLADLGKVAGLGGVEELTAAVKANLDGKIEASAAGKLLTEAGDLHRASRDAMKASELREAANLLTRAQQKYLQAYAMSVPSRPGEMRALWCHNPSGVWGQSWDETMKAVADAGFNTVIVNSLWGGWASYPSKLLPSLERAKGKDMLAECIAAGKKRGVAVHVWKVNWRADNKTPQAFRKELTEAGRMQRNFGGKVVPWLCPSQPANQKLELESMLEVVRNYDVDGIHFDYIRYGGSHVCYCNRCRERFEAEGKLKVADWPKDVYSGKLKDKYRQFRRDNITRLVRAVSEQSRKLKPKVMISAAVFWNWPVCRDEKGQDWKLWIDRGYLDFVCPMEYTTSAAALEARARATAGWVGGKIPLMHGIGATLGQRPDQTLQQILIARKHSRDGFVLFQLGPMSAEEHLPLLRLGATATKTTWRPPAKNAKSK